MDEDIRIKDLPSVEDGIQSNDYIAVDNEDDGTRKATIQDVMEANVSGLETTATNTKGAINELFNKASRTVSLTQAEYDALPSSKLSDDIAYFITDGEPDVDNALWTKVGRATLDTQAQNCSEAINEIKQSLSKLQVYSTAKFDTGKKWIDGKTIWGKVYTGYAVSNNTVELDTLTVDTIIHGYGWARSENNNSWGIPSGRQDGYENRWLYNLNTHKLSVQFGSAYLSGIYPFNFIIEFTE